MAKIIPFQIKLKDPEKTLTPSDKQTIDAIELLIEYMAEVGCDINSIVDSKELGDVIHRLHILIHFSHSIQEERFRIPYGHN